MSTTNVPMQNPVVPACFLYQHINYAGSTLAVTGDIANFVPLGFNDVASSLVITKGTWTVYQHINFGGKSKSFGPGIYPNFVDMGINDSVSSIKLSSAEVPMQNPVVPACFLYEHINYEGSTLTVTGDVKTFVTVGFNDVASSLIVTKGTWTVYEHINFGGKSKEFGPGVYPTFVGLGINDMVSSIKLTHSH